MSRRVIIAELDVESLRDHGFSYKLNIIMINEYKVNVIKTQHSINQARCLLYDKKIHENYVFTCETKNHHKIEVNIK